MAIRSQSGRASHRPHGWLMVKETANSSGVRPSSVAAITELLQRKINPEIAEPLDVAATGTVALRCRKLVIRQVCGLTARSKAFRERAISVKVHPWRVSGLAFYENFAGLGLAQEKAAAII